MEGVQKRRNAGVRRSFKRSFKQNNDDFILIPFEIWEVIVSRRVCLKTIGLLAQTCRGFAQFVETTVKKSLRLAFRCRRAGYIVAAARCLAESARTGNARAMHYMGRAYLAGDWGFSVNKRMAEEWFLKGAEHGNPRSMAFYAFFNRDDSNWARKALASDDLYAVAYCHLNALGTPQNRELAFELFEKSAVATGREDECRCTGRRYMHETPQDGGKAFYWFSKSAVLGCPESQYDLALLYHFGRGVPEDNETSLSWFKKARKQMKMPVVMYLIPFFCNAAL